MPTQAPWKKISISCQSDSQPQTVMAGTWQAATNERLHVWSVSPTSDTRFVPLVHPPDSFMPANLVFNCLLIYLTWVLYWYPKWALFNFSQFRSISSQRLTNVSTWTYGTPHDPWMSPWVYATMRSGDLATGLQCCINATFQAGDGKKASSYAPLFAVFCQTSVSVMSLFEKSSSFTIAWQCMFLFL